jgi:Fe-S cluster assembly protein SufD
MTESGTHPLIEQWSDNFRAQPIQAGPEWLQQLRKNAAAEFVTAGLPGRKTEAWKYTPLRVLEQRAPAVGDEGQTEFLEETFPPSVGGADALVVNFENGRLCGDLPETPDGLSLLPMTEGLDVFGQKLQELIPSVDTTGTGRMFSALNTAFLQQGLVVHVGENVQAGALHLRWAFTPEGNSRLANVRIILLLDEGAKLEVVEQYESVADTAGSLNLMAQAELGRGASLVHTRILKESDEAVLLTSTQVEQSAESSYQYSGFDLGGGLVRHELHSRLSGEGAQAGFDGAFVLDRKRHVDNHISVDHTAPGCSSSQFFRGVLGGRSRGVFNGRALIRPGADDSVVRQSNANLLLSGLAEIDTKPELEIYADEVEASHGATVGQLDESAIFYMRSRGLSDAQARRLLTAAFCHAVTDRLADRVLAENLSGMIDAAMPESLPEAGQEQ